MTQRRKARKEFYNAPLHKRRKIMSSHLSDKLLLRYNIRSFPVKKGDRVKIVRGSLRGLVEKVAEVDRKALKIMIEGATIAKADRKMVPRKIDPSNVIIVDLDLKDQWRRKKLEKLAERKLSKLREKRKEKIEKEEKKAEEKKKEAKEEKKDEIKKEIKEEVKEEVKK